MEAVKNKTSQDFAEGHKQKYLLSRERLKSTPFWKFKDVETLRGQMRRSEYYYRKITGKQIELPKK